MFFSAVSSLRESVTLCFLKMCISNYLLELMHIYIGYIFYLLLSVYFQMNLSCSCMNRRKVTLVAFIWFYPSMNFELQSGNLGPSIGAQIATLSLQSNDRGPNRPEPTLTFSYWQSESDTDRIGHSCDVLVLFFLRQKVRVPQKMTQLCIHMLDNHTFKMPGQDVHIFVPLCRWLSISHLMRNIQECAWLQQNVGWIWRQ